MGRRVGAVRGRRPRSVEVVPRRTAALRQDRSALAVQVRHLFREHGVPGYVTEKVFDALVAGCIPVYLGAPDIEEYVPADALVDARRFRNYGELEKCLREMTSGEADRRLAAARAFLGSDAATPFRQRRHVEEIAAALIGDPV